MSVGDLEWQTLDVVSGWEMKHVLLLLRLEMHSEYKAEGSAILFNCKWCCKLPGPHKRTLASRSAASVSECVSVLKDYGPSSGQAIYKGTIPD